MKVLEGPLQGKKGSYSIPSTWHEGSALKRRGRGNELRDSSYNEKGRGEDL